MKINGSKQTFGFDSALWSNKETLNVDSLQIDDDEAKFASYWTVPFTELRVGMKVDGTTKWITINQAATSLFSLIADGQHRSTSIGKDKWRSLLPRTSMQSNCNKAHTLYSATISYTVIALSNGVPTFIYAPLWLHSKENFWGVCIIAADTDTTLRTIYSTYSYLYSVPYIRFFFSKQTTLPTAHPVNGNY